MKTNDCDLCRKDVLSLLSHELRNPLAALGNSLYVLKWSQPGGAKAERAITTMERQIGKLSTLISALTDAARINQGKVELRRAIVDLRDVVRASARDSDGMFAEHKLLLDLEVPEDPVLVWADAGRLEDALDNLLDNAARFTPPGGTVTVSVERDTTAPLARVRVRDSGIGLDGDLRARLFQPFSQGDTSLARTRGGLGLGLMLVKGLVELHGGSVQAESQGPGAGSVFTIELPASTKLPPNALRAAE
jgi:signal transduction histidine kinase